VEDLHFIWSDFVAEEAAAAFDDHERRISERLPNVEIRHTGGTSVRGVLTSGDVDLQVRVGRRLFRSACNVLYELYEPLYPDACHSDSAYFVAAPPSAAPALRPRPLASRRRYRA